MCMFCFGTIETWETKCTHLTQVNTWCILWHEFTLSLSIPWSSEELSRTGMLLAKNFDTMSFPEPLYFPRHSLYFLDRHNQHFPVSRAKSAKRRPQSLFVLDGQTENKVFTAPNVVWSLNSHADSKFWSKSKRKMADLKPLPDRVAALEKEKRQRDFQVPIPG